MPRLASFIAVIFASLFSARSSPVGKDYCYFGSLLVGGLEVRLSFVNATHMTYNLTSYYGSKCGSKRIRGPLVTGIPYQYNSTTGIIDANADNRAKEFRVYKWLPFAHVKPVDLHRMEYDSSRDVIKLKLKKGTALPRKTRTFWECW
ncbi:hypothetical protein FOZ63_020492 [Perkinsus olseni]|uniref:Uncharacterized protein n=1 Tax=Perkinsus olseni TaxID=32597 RepID=A0A7J6PSJ2_PEROL|nr:hypothetical protein FOZ63_020492 [Perkinsus olseni]